MHEILRRLTRDVEMTIRIALAERLADDAAAPLELILLLCDDAIEVARPVLLRSPLLSDDDILKLIVSAGHAHHEAVAGRPHIGEPVTDHLAKSEKESVLLALVHNATAKISSATYEILVEKSRRIAMLQEPLSHRADLPPALATRMCEWVSDALKAYIVKSYPITPNRLTVALSDATNVLKNDPATPRAAPAESAQKLVEKLAISGQLKAGFLLRVLHQGQLDLFDLGLAKLTNIPLPELRAKFYDGGPRAVALACRGVGIDRCVFNTVYNLSRQARDLRATLTVADQAEVERVFTTLSKPVALGELASLKFN